MLILLNKRAKFSLKLGYSVTQPVRDCLILKIYSKERERV